MRREFLMLAHPYDPRKFGLVSTYASEKLDGVRAFWDGGISRGKPCDLVPYANTDKHGRYLIQPIATGLWTRYGQPIQAPKSFLDQLPIGMCLDGELTAGRNTFQDTVSTVRSLSPDPTRWEQIRYAAFDAPSYRSVFADGDLRSPNFKKSFRGILRGFVSESVQARDRIEDSTPFYRRYAILRESLPVVGQISVHPQTQLSSCSVVEAEKDMKRFFDLVLDQGGEGLILKSPVCQWTPQRSTMMVKVKGIKDDEAEILGMTWAEPTNMTLSVTGEKTDKLLGLMGSLRVRYKGVDFNIGTGFTDVERKIFLSGNTEERGFAAALEYGRQRPGEPIPPTYYSKQFRVGEKVTFRYRELTEDGIPKEARYLRLRPDGI